MATRKQLMDPNFVTGALNEVDGLITVAIGCDLGFDAYEGLPSDGAAGIAARLKPSTLREIERLVDRQILLLPIQVAHSALARDKTVAVNEFDIWFRRNKEDPRNQLVHAVKKYLQAEQPQTHIQEQLPPGNFHRRRSGV